MARLIDREKVIAGLEKVWDALDHMEHELYADYVYDALALLKAQEPPRVLALEELQDWNDAVWFDELGEDAPFIALIDNYDTTIAEISFVDTTLYRKLTSHDMRLYNKWWRCWSSKPTDEQREAVPWKA